MPFDAELNTGATNVPSPAQTVADRLMARIADPDPAWAAGDPARLMAWLYISPRPCAALEALLADQG